MNIYLNLDLQNGMMNERVRLIRSACIFTLTFILFWLPIGILTIPYDLPEEIVPQTIKTHFITIREFIYLMGYVVVSFTPIMLFILSHNLRKHIGRCNNGK